MAQSLFEIIENGRIEVNHNGDDVTFDIPEWLKAASGKLENEEDLLTWARENKVVHALLHAGIADTIIGLRATIRPVDRKEGEDRVKVSLIRDEINAQKRAKEFTIKPKIRPGTGSTSVKVKAEIDTLTKVIQAMREAGLDTETIHKMQDPVFGKVKVALAINNTEI